MDTDKQILELSLKKLSEAFDEFIGACIDDNGKPKEPKIQDLMKAKGCLPPYCKHSFNKKQDK